MILAVIRGDYDVNEIKLAHAVKAYQLRHATPEEIRAIGSELGFISPVGLSVSQKGKKLIIVGDISLRTVKNMYTGANAKHKDYINVNIDRDYSVDIETDIALAREGDLAEDAEPLIVKKGIEVGNIFQLGFHYSSRMKDATFTAEDGSKKPYYMGCYGIGLARTLATIVEKFHDNKGIIWPENISPFAVHLISIKQNKNAEEIYDTLQKNGIDVLYDDREVSAGEKFADADLLGMPVRLVVSKKTGEKIEWKKRTEERSELLSVSEILQKLSKR